MSRVLILDDDQLFCRTLRDGLLLTRELEVTDVDTTNSVDKATLRIIRAVETNSPYDIFLVDQYLGNGTDGIQVMTDLRRVSPSTDAIVFTGMGDPTSGKRAYAAGAARYLQKPFEIDELIAIMQSLKEWRRVLHERTWMQALIEITEETEKLQDFSQVACAIVEGALRLGFERAYLLWVPERQPADGMDMVGMHMAGSYAIPEFTGQRFRVQDSPYALAASQSRDVLFLNRYNQGRGVMEKQFGPERFPPPVGAWACLPLWSNDRFSGILVLDNADRDAVLSDDQRNLLQLYARQVTAILERARLFGRELHNRLEIQLINQIGKQIMVYVNDLDRLLEEIRSQVSQRFNVQSFFIAMVNEETQKLDFRLHYEAGKRRAHHTRRLHAGLTGHIVQMQAREPLYIPSGTEAYCQAHAVHAFGKPAKCWVGIPLWVVNRMIGVMVIQHYEQEGYYTQSDVDLLAAVADHIAGAIYVARLVELEQTRLNLLQFNETVDTATAWANEVARNINQEVGKIRDQVYWIKENLNDPEKIRPHLDRIVESSAKLSSVGPLGSLTYKPFHVNADLERWVTSFVETIEAEIEVKFDFCKDRVIQANTIGLERVLRHLVTNAIQAMKEGGALTVRTLTSGHDQSLEIQIEDSGPGIDETIRQQIFQQPVTTKEGRGGFGLLLARQIIEGMNGIIWIQPQALGRGTTFCIRLPILERSADEAAPGSGAATEPPAGPPPTEQPPAQDLPSGNPVPQLP